MELYRIGEDVEIMEGKRKADLEKYLPGVTKGGPNKLDLAYEVQKMSSQMRHLQAGGGIANVVNGEYQHGVTNNTNNTNNTNSLNDSAASDGRAAATATIPEDPIINGTRMTDNDNQNMSNQHVSRYREAPTPAWINELPTVSIPSWMDEDDNESARAIRLLNLRIRL